MSREAESWFMEEPVKSESIVTEVESKDTTFDFGFEVSDRVVGGETETKEENGTKMDEIITSKGDGTDLDETRVQMKSSAKGDKEVYQSIDVSRESDAESWFMGVPFITKSVVTEISQVESRDSTIDVGFEVSERVVGAEVETKGNEDTKEPGSPTSNQNTREEDAGLSIETHKGDLKRGKEDHEISTISSGERERARQEEIFRRRYGKAMELSRSPRAQQNEDKVTIPSVKSLLYGKTARTDIVRTDYSHVSTSVLQSTNKQEAPISSTLEREMPTTQDVGSPSKLSYTSRQDFCGSSVSSTGLGDDKYDVNGVESNLTENNTSYVDGMENRSISSYSDNQNIASATSSMSSESNFTEKSVEVSLSASASLGQVISNDVEGLEDLSHSFGDTTNESLNDIISLDISEDFTNGSLTIDESVETNDESIESSVREKKSFSLETSLDSYEGTATSFEGTTGSSTDASSTIAESFSDNVDDPLKMIDILGWMADTCGTPKAAMLPLKSSEEGENNESAATIEKANGKDSTMLLKKKLELFTDYVKTETPLKHLSHVEDCTPSRAPLSPTSTSISNIVAFFGKTPKHANTSTAPKEKLNDTTHEETDYGTEESDIEEFVDENAPASSSSERMSPKADSVSTSADTIQAGIRRAQIQNKILSGARKKMEAATLLRQKRASATSGMSSRPPFPPVISEDMETQSVETRSLNTRNRWKKQTNNYVEYSRRSSSHRRNQRRSNKSRKKSVATSS